MANLSQINQAKIKQEKPKCVISKKWSNDLREGEGTMTYGEKGNKYEG